MKKLILLLIPVVLALALGGRYQEALAGIEAEDIAKETP